MTTFESIRQILLCFSYYQIKPLKDQNQQCVCWSLSTFQLVCGTQDNLFHLKTIK